MSSVQRASIVVAAWLAASVVLPPRRVRADVELGVDLGLAGGAAIAEDDTRGLFSVEGLVDLLYTPGFDESYPVTRWAIGPTVGYAFGTPDEHSLVAGLTFTLGRSSDDSIFDTLAFTATAGGQMMVSESPVQGAAFARIFAGFHGPGVATYKWATFGFFVETRIYPNSGRTDVIGGITFDIALLTIGPLVLLFETMGERRVEPSPPRPVQTPPPSTPAPLPTGPAY